MVPLTQTRTGKHGTCFQTALASILELPLNSVPDFQGEGNDWLDQVARFLEPMGLAYVQIDVDDPILEIMFKHGETYSTIEGMSPNDLPHACVALNGELVWDPDPRKVGLKTVECFGLLFSRCNTPQG